MISEGRNINVTLIFSLERYDEVIEAYLSGLEELARSGGDLASTHSVASFFVSRVDTEVDRRLGAVGERAAGLAGKAAVAQARLAYRLFEERFSGERWQRLSAQGAHPQRPLWASTSTKNPAYPDLLYVEGLIGPHTVDTMPDATVDAFSDHGKIVRTVDTGVDAARTHLDRLAEVGVSMADVARVLEPGKPRGEVPFQALFRAAPHRTTRAPFNARGSPVTYAVLAAGCRVRGGHPAPLRRSAFRIPPGLVGVRSPVPLRPVDGLPVLPGRA